MKQFELKVGVTALKLKVKFPCTISLALKYHSNEYPIMKERSLTDGQLSYPMSQFSSLEAEYQQTQGNIADFEKVSFLLYLNSIHGEMLIGSFSYRINELLVRKVYTQSISNSPDSSAEIQIEIEVILSSEASLGVASSVQNGKKSDLNQKTNRYPQIRERMQTQNYEASPSRVLSSSPSNFQTIRPHHRYSGKTPEIPSKQQLLKSNLFERRSEQYNYQQKPLLNEGKGKAQSLKRKVSEMRLVNTETNKNYLEKIMTLEKESKLRNQKISHIELDSKLKDNKIKFQQKEIKSKNQKIESLEKQQKTVQKRLSQSEQKVRQLHYSIKNQIEEQKKLQQTITLEGKKQQNKQEYLKEQIDQISKKAVSFEKEKDQCHFVILSLKKQISENTKKEKEHIKEQDKAFNHQKDNYSKSISVLELQIQESQKTVNAQHSQITFLENEVRNWKMNHERAQVGINKERKYQQELLFQQNTLEIENKQLEHQLQEEHQVNEKNKQLQKQLQEKLQQIQSLLKKLAVLEEELTQSEGQVKQLVINAEGLQEQYQQLYYEKMSDCQEIEHKKATIAHLIEDYEQLEKTIEKLSLALNSQEQQSSQSISELNQNIRRLNEEQEKAEVEMKQVKTELSEQVQRRKFVEKQLYDNEKQLEKNEMQIEKMQTQAASGYMEISNVKGVYEVLDNKNKYVIKQLEECKAQKQSNELQLRKEIQELEMHMQQKEGQIDNQKETLSAVKHQNQQLNQIVEDLSLKNQNTEKQVDEMKLQLLLRNSELKQTNQTQQHLEQNNFQFKNCILELNQKIEYLQTELQKVNQQTKSIEDSLRIRGSLFDDQVKESTPNHENRINMVQSLAKTIDNQKLTIEQKDHNIQHLVGQLHLSNDQRDQLAEGHATSKKEIAEMVKSKEQLELCIMASIDDLRKSMTNHGINLLTGKVNSYTTSNLFGNDNEIETKLVESMKQFNSVMKDSIRQRDSLKVNLSERQNTNKELSEELQKTKDLYSALLADTQELSKQLNFATGEESESKISIKTLRDKIESGKKVCSALQFELRQEKAKTLKISNENSMQSDKINNLNLAVDKKTVQLKEAEEKMAQKQVRSDKEISLLKLQISEKTRSIVGLENDKKNRINVLNQANDQLRKQNYDLQTIVFSEKSNCKKLHSILNQFNSYIPKMEKAHNLKSYSMMPLNNILLEFKQIMRASDKVYADFDKKYEKGSLAKGMEPLIDPKPKKRTSYT